MKTRYITIEREYGSGGTTIARRLSRETGIPCYGREILEAVAARYHKSIAEIERCEEAVTGSILYSLFAISQISSANPDMLTTQGHLFLAEQEEIRRLAANGPAVFLGHCASEALKKQEGGVRVFIRCSDDAEKRRRIAEEYGIPQTDIDSTRKRFDRKRANYYHANTAQKWDDFRNYDIVLDSAALGEEVCVRLLKACFM